MRFGTERRARRVVGGVCVLAGLVSSLAFGGPRAEAAMKMDGSRPDVREPAEDSWRGSRHPVWLRSEDPATPPVLVYPSNGANDQAPPLVLLHGMCGHPENECPWFAGSATENRLVVCPRADLTCAGGGSIWSGATALRKATVNGARARFERAFSSELGSKDDAVLVGFSLGAFAALDVAEESHGEWKRLLLIGAFVKPNAKKLKAAGVESVLFASGDWDMSRESMKTEARALARAGIRARYVGMGPVGHRFAKDMDAWLKDALAWLEEKPLA